MRRLRLTMAFGALLALAGCGPVDAPLQDLRTVKRPDSPNSYLICPKDLCAAKADEDGPIVSLTPEKVLVAALKVASQEENASTMEADVTLGQYVFVQRTRFLRFPDVVRVQAIGLPDGRTAVALYSHSVYGRYDFGANKARAQRWMAAIRREIGAN